MNNAIEQVPVSDIIVKFRYNARCHWLKEHADETVVCFVNRVGFENRKYYVGNVTDSLL